MTATIATIKRPPCIPNSSVNSQPSSSVSKKFSKASLKLKPVYTNPNASNFDLEGVAKPSVDHFHVVEVFESENTGEITYDDATSDDIYLHTASLCGNADDHSNHQEN